MKRFFLYIWFAITFLLVGFQADNWLENMVLEHEDEIATIQAIQTRQFEALLPPAEILEPFPTATAQRTNTPSPTSTLAIPATPTQEVWSTATQMPPATNTLVSTTAPSDPSCRVSTTSNLTLRESPGSNAASKGTLPAGSVITVYPYSSSIYAPSQTVDYAWWYVRVADTDTDPYNDAWVAYAKTVAPRLTTPGITPVILESYFAQVGALCNPTIPGLAPAPSSTPTSPATSTPLPTATPVQVSVLSPFTVSGNLVYLNGQPFKYVGVNFRELIGYDNIIMPYASPADVVAQIDGAKALGMRVVRFYISHKSLTVEQAIPRVRHILDLLKERDMYAILVISDGAYSGFEVKDNSINRAFNGIDRYTHAFYEGGYRQNYLPYVERMTAAIGAHPAIFSWEPLNEATTINLSPTTAQMNAFLNFYSETAAVIRRNSPGKLVSSGLESCYQLFVLNSYDNGRYCEKLYAIVDIGTLHTYQSFNGNTLGSSYMHILREMELQQPLIIEEVSGFWEVETSDWLNLLVKAAFNRMTGLMHWNMSFPYCRDLGVGDGAWNACNGTAQSRRWFHLTGFLRALADQLRLAY